MIWAMFGVGLCGMMVGFWTSSDAPESNLCVHLAMIYAGTALCIVAVICSLGRALCP